MSFIFDANETPEQARARKRKHVVNAMVQQQAGLPPMPAVPTNQPEAPSQPSAGIFGQGGVLGSNGFLDKNRTVLGSAMMGGGAAGPIGALAGAALGAGVQYLHNRSQPSAAAQQATAQGWDGFSAQPNMGSDPGSRIMRGEFPVIEKPDPDAGTKSITNSRPAAGLADDVGNVFRRLFG